tara:strand:+ start:121 stop:579 length:459 start_codon:yes stop_codon:yes gene_type:complete
MDPTGLNEEAVVESLNNVALHGDDDSNAPDGADEHALKVDGQNKVGVENVWKDRKGDGVDKPNVEQKESETAISHNGSEFQMEGLSTSQRMAVESILKVRQILHDSPESATSSFWAEQFDQLFVQVLVSFFKTFSSMSLPVCQLLSVDGFKP